MATEREQAEREALLRWLKQRSPEQDVEDAETMQIRRNLLQGRRPPRHQNAPLVKELLPPTRKATAHDYRQAERNAVGWHSLGFDVQDVQPWLRAGADPGEHQLVADLVEEGITSERLAEQFTHPRTGERVTVLDIARDFYANYRHNWHRTLCDALDDAGVERVRGLRPSRLLRRNNPA